MGGRGPIVRDEREGTRAICACGRTSFPPYCDGSHPADVEPIMVDVEQARRIAWCTCLRSRNFPYCDGSHSDAGAG